MVNNKGADQTSGMLVCAFAVRKQQSQSFSRRGPYDIEAQASWPPSGYAPVLYRGRELYLLIYLPNGLIASSNIAREAQNRPK